MNERPLQLLDAFPGLRVLVVGAAILDSYLEGHAARLCREAPVPIVSVNARRDMPGGAANAAVNLGALGAQVSFLSVVGADAAATSLRSALRERRIGTDELLVEPGRTTVTKRRVSADGQLLLRYDEGSTDPLAAGTERALIARLELLFGSVDAVLVSDYGYGLLSEPVIATLAALQASRPRVLVVDAKDVRRYRAVGATAAKPNYGEAVRLLGEPESEASEVRVAQVAGGAQRLLSLTGAQIVAVTLDRDGALLLEEGQAPYRTYARANPHSRAAGAGDTFVGALTLALAAGAPVPLAAELAAAAASVVVDKQGTASCSAAELREHFLSQEKVLSERRVLLARTAAWHEQGRRIVFTNGCFDLLHRGHITYLNRAKALGDVLVVGLNDDAGVRRLKGAERPINALEDRAQVLAGLSAVDLIVPFATDTPAELIRLIKPHVYVKGGDYTLEMLPEASAVASVGGEVSILPYLEDRSTTRIIERVRAADALHELRPSAGSGRRQ